MSWRCPTKSLLQGGGTTPWWSLSLCTRIKWLWRNCLLHPSVGNLPASLVKGGFGKKRGDFGAGVTFCPTWRALAVVGVWNQSCLTRVPQRGSAFKSDFFPDDLVFKVKLESLISFPCSSPLRKKNLQGSTAIPDREESEPFIPKSPAGSCP